MKNIKTKKYKKKDIYTTNKKNVFRNNLDKIPKKKKIISNYLYKNKKLKKGIFLKKPVLNEILYPFYLNLKLVNEYLKKK